MELDLSKDFVGIEHDFNQSKLDYELNQKKQNPSYTIKNPEILVEVVEAFRKSLEINPDVQPKNGLLGPLKGQKVCASDIHNLGVKYLKEKNLMGG